MALLVGSAMLVGAAFIIDLPQLEGEPVRYVFGPFSLLGIAALHPRVLRPATDRPLMRAGREPLPVVLPFGAVLHIAAGYSVTLLLAGVSTYALVEALTDVGSHAVVTATGAFAVGFAASGVAFILPAEIGAKEGAMAAALPPVAPLAVGTAVAVAQRLARTLLEVAWAAVSTRTGKCG
ncbi:MAG: hypothetical protein WKF96_18620 [Solirubrobacteraceae bacterium]